MLPIKPIKSENALNYIIARSPEDIKKVRIPGMDKPFEQMTIGELTQLRPGGTAEDNYTIEGFGSDISITTSARLAQLAKLSGQVAVEHELAAAALRTTPIVNKLIR